MLRCRMGGRFLPLDVLAPGTSDNSNVGEATTATAMTRVCLHLRLEGFGALEGLAVLDAVVAAGPFRGMPIGHTVWTGRPLPPAAAPAKTKTKQTNKQKLARSGSALVEILDSTKASPARQKNDSNESSQ